VVLDTYVLVHEVTRRNVINVQNWRISIVAVQIDCTICVEFVIQCIAHNPRFIVSLFIEEMISREVD
jgi:hypothetical protein